MLVWIEKSRERKHDRPFGVNFLKHVAMEDQILKKEKRKKKRERHPRSSNFILNKRTGPEQ
jgi:hypothetical protein